MTPPQIDIILKSLMYLVPLFILPVLFYVYKVSKMGKEWMNQFKPLYPIEWSEMTTLRLFGLSLGPGLNPDGCKFIQHLFGDISGNDSFKILTKKLRFEYLKLFFVSIMFMLFNAFVAGVFLGVTLMGHTLE